MGNELDDAVGSIKVEAESAAVWFQPEGEKRFLSPDLITSFAEILILTFLSGFQQEATKAAKKGGKDVFIWMRDSIAGLFRHGHAAPAHPDAKSITEGAAHEAGKLSDDEMAALAEQTRKALEAELAKTLPKKQATALAAKVATQSMEKILKKGRPKKRGAKPK